LLRFEDTWRAERIGWREIVVQGDGVAVISSTAPARSATARLTAYPDDPLAEPLGLSSVDFSVTGSGPTLPPFAVPDADPLGPSRGDAVEETAGQQSAAEDAAAERPALPGGIGELGADLTRIVQSEDLSPSVLVLSLLVAAGLGAVHALSPGHGKTVMAAYLVGSRGTASQALGLGLTVTIAHTLGVLALGVITLSAGAVLPPERLYPILGLVSGVLVLGIGLYLVFGRVRVWQAERAHASLHDEGHDHEHAPGSGRGHEHPHESGRDRQHRQAGNPHDEHDHADHRDDAGGWHSHGLVRHSHIPARGGDLRWRGLFALGLSGGMVPSVSALILLLGSVSLGRPAYGIVLTAAFGVGMAIVLVGVGMALVYARGLLERLPTRTRSARLTALLPTATAVVVLLAGGFITVQAALTLG
jgi:nickel/cobalt transporter (NicO) family protein